VARQVAKSLARIHWLPGSAGLCGAVREQSTPAGERYLNDDGIRGTTLAAVAGSVDAQTQIVIGHSLGSVIVTRQLIDLRTRCHCC